MRQNVTPFYGRSQSADSPSQANRATFSGTNAPEILINDTLLCVFVALLTNTDNNAITETERTIGVKFDDIITAEQVKAYKPSHKGFLLARERLGLPVSEIWHAGFGFKYDIVPASEPGYTTVWVNRQGEARSGRAKESFCTFLTS